MLDGIKLGGQIRINVYISRTNAFSQFIHREKTVTSFYIYGIG